MTLACSTTVSAGVVSSTSTSNSQRDDVAGAAAAATTISAATTTTTTAMPLHAASSNQQQPNGWFRSVPLKKDDDEEEVQEDEIEEGSSSSSAGNSRTGSPSSTLTASSTDGTTVSSSNNNKKRAQFDTTVSVKVIPNRHDYSSDIKRAIWSDKKECKETKLRNMKEFAKEGYDWRNAGETSNDIHILRPKAMHPYRDVGTYLVNDIELVSRPPCPCPILDEQEEDYDDEDFIIEAVEEVVNFVVDKDDFLFSSSSSSAMTGEGDPVMRPPCPCPSAMNGEENNTTTNEFSYLDHDAYVATIMMHLNLPKPIPMRCNPIAIDDPLYINGNVEEDDYPLLDGDEEDYESSSADACIFSIEDVLNIYDGKHQHNHYRHHQNHCYDARPPPSCVVIPAVPVYHHHHYPTTMMAAALDG